MGFVMQYYGSNTRAIGSSTNDTDVVNSVLCSSKCVDLKNPDLCHTSISSYFKGPPEMGFLSLKSILQNRLTSFKLIFTVVWGLHLQDCGNANFHNREENCDVILSTN